MNAFGEDNVNATKQNIRNRAVARLKQKKKQEDFGAPSGSVTENIKKSIAAKAAQAPIPTGKFNKRKAIPKPIDSTDMIKRREERRKKANAAYEGMYPNS